VGITAVFVTHDQEEAFALSDRIALLDRGRLQQFGTPEELYESPENAFVATFVGRGTELRAALLGVDGEYATVEIGAGARWVVRPIGKAASFEAGQIVRLIVRPEALVIRPSADPADPVIIERRFAGGFAVYTVRLSGAQLLVQGPLNCRIGDHVSISPRAPDRVFAVAF
jgi:ABC-type Fe3+/spermidine/putrescine transport system ATPase subunit